MNILSFIVQPLRLVGALSLGACIQTDCVTLPCLLPQALTVTVSNAASGGAVQNAVVQISGQVSGPTLCSGTPVTCSLASSPGTYSVTVSAPGFQSATRSVTVAGVAQTDDCHCPAVETPEVSVALAPN